MGVDWCHSPIAFSVTNEDHRIVERALAPAAGSHLVTITSAGDTPLNCLCLDPARVDAVDADAGQTHLAALKLAGMAALDCDDFHQLLGVFGAEPAAALACYRRAREGLPPAARRFWDGNLRVIAAGVVGQGRMVQLFARVRWLLRILAGRQALTALARVSSGPEAEAFVRDHLEAPAVRALLRLVCSRFVLRRFYPGALDRVFGTEPPYLYARRLAVQALGRHPVAGNPYLYPFLFGRYPGLGSLPPYLAPRQYGLVRGRTDRIRLVHADLLAHLRTLEADVVDGFAISNLMDWLCLQRRAELMAHIVRVARHGARVLVLSRTALPAIPQQLRRWLHVRERSPALLALDRSGFHRAIEVWCVDKAAPGEGILADASAGEHVQRLPLDVHREGSRAYAVPIDLHGQVGRQRGPLPAA